LKCFSTSVFDVVSFAAKVSENKYQGKRKREKKYLVNKLKIKSISPLNDSFSPNESQFGS